MKHLYVAVTMLAVCIACQPAFGMAREAWNNPGEPPFWSTLFEDASPVSYIDQELDAGVGAALPIMRWGSTQMSPTQKPCNSLDFMLGSDTTADLQGGFGTSTTLLHIARTLNSEVAIPEALRLGLALLYDKDDQDDENKDSVKGVLYAGWDF